jgi:hypothetical protein
MNKSGCVKILFRNVPNQIPSVHPRRAVQRSPANEIELCLPVGITEWRRPRLQTDVRFLSL